MHRLQRPHALLVAFNDQAQLQQLGYTDTDHVGGKRFPKQLGHRCPQLGFDFDGKRANAGDLLRHGQIGIERFLLWFKP